MNIFKSSCAYDILRGSSLRAEQNKKMKEMDLTEPPYTKMETDPAPRE